MASKLENIRKQIKAIDVKVAKLQYRKVELEKRVRDMESKQRSSATSVDTEPATVSGSEVTTPTPTELAVSEASAPSACTNSEVEKYKNMARTNGITDYDTFLSLLPPASVEELSFGTKFELRRWFNSLSSGVAQ